MVQVIWDVLSVPAGTPEHMQRRQEVQNYLAKNVPGERTYHAALTRLSPEELEELSALAEKDV
jgi:hypothetical protein